MTTPLRIAMTCLIGFMCSVSAVPGAYAAPDAPSAPAGGAAGASKQTTGQQKFVIHGGSYLPGQDIETLQGPSGSTTNTYDTLKWFTDTMLVSLIRLGMSLAAGISVLMIVYGGYRYATSMGDEKKGGKDIILYACIGLGIALLSYALVEIVLSISFGEPISAAPAE